MAQPEGLLHYIWKHRLFERNLSTEEGIPVEVIDVGTINTHAGPDFFNAKLRIGQQIWAGNVEIHTCASDWNKHKHYADKAYNTVILHVVEYSDCEVYNQLGEKIPQCRIGYPRKLKDNADFLLHADVDTPCSAYLHGIPPVQQKHWLTALLLERLQRKTDDLEKLLAQFQNSWDEVFYILLCRCFGFGLNSDSFQLLAQHTPFHSLQRERDDIRSVEAILFGQAGLLHLVEECDTYTLFLQQEYANLKVKYQLKPLEAHLFRSLRTRPRSQPHIRIAQIASLLYREDKLFSKVINCQQAGELRLLFHEHTSEYWQTHQRFGIASSTASKALGDSSIEIIIINAVVPILFSFGKYAAQPACSDRAFALLEELKPEANSIVKRFRNFGIEVKHAGDSQALIQLQREYCEKRKCLFCRFGYYVLTK